VTRIVKFLAEAARSDVAVEVGGVNPDGATDSDDRQAVPSDETAHCALTHLHEEVRYAPQSVEHSYIHRLRPWISIHAVVAPDKRALRLPPSYRAFQQPETKRPVVDRVVLE
jgi:hypothetical protein